jgi:hypothetical protein
MSDNVTQGVPAQQGTDVSGSAAVDPGLAEGGVPTATTAAADPAAPPMPAPASVTDPQGEVTATAGMEAAPAAAPAGVTDPADVPAAPDAAPAPATVAVVEGDGVNTALAALATGSNPGQVVASTDLVFCQPFTGATVLFVIPDGHPSAGQVRAAHVVQALPPACANLTVMLDPFNDPVENWSPVWHKDGGGVVSQFRSWPSVQYDAGGAPGTWHWPA